MGSSSQQGFARRLYGAFLIVGVGLLIGSVAVDFLPTATAYVNLTNQISRHF